MDQIDEAIEHAGGEGTTLRVAWDQFHVHRANGRRNRHRAYDGPRRQVPNTNRTSNLHVANKRVERGHRVNEITGHHQVQLWTYGNPMRIETLSWRVFRPFLHQSQGSAAVRKDRTAPDHARAGAPAAGGLGQAVEN